MYDVIALGELLVDLAERTKDENGYPTLAANPGGAPGNFLAALSAYGKKTAFLAKVGDDTFGHLLTGTMRRAGIDTRGILISPDTFTTLAFVTFDAHGDRSFAFARKPGADTQLRWEEIDPAMLEQARVFHFGSLSCTDEPARTATQKAAAYARAHGKLVTYDPNYRAPLWKTEQEAKAQILWGLSQADIVKISDEETQFLWGCGPEEGAERVLALGARLVMVTLGPKGCLLKNAQAEFSCGCPKVHPIDTTGAGDIFGGSAVSRFLELNKAPEALTPGRSCLYGPLRSGRRQSIHRGIRRHSVHSQEGNCPAKNAGRARTDTHLLKSSTERDANGAARETLCPSGRDCGRALSVCWGICGQNQQNRFGKIYAKPVKSP